MALKQRFAQIAATKEKLTLADRAQRMKQVELDIKRENKWYKLTYISIGVLIGVLLTFWGMSVKEGLNSPAPVVHIEGS